MDWVPIEAALASAADEGIERNFARWMRFAGMQPGEWFELQLLGVRGPYGERTRFAHANAIENAAPLLVAAERLPASGAYVIANRVNDAVATRREPGKWHEAMKGQSTTDRDILARRVLFIDIDAKRPSGTSANETELSATLPVAAAVYERLALAVGHESIGIGHSGNGRQIFVALEEVPESETVGTTIRALLEALGARFTVTGAQIDTTVHDAKRLVPAFGTLKRKGASGIADRPHRRTAFVCAETVKRVTYAQLEELVPWLQAEVPGAERPAGSSPGTKTEERNPGLPGRPFERANAAPIEEIAAWLSLLDDGALRCPGCGNTNGVGFVNNGLKCLHNSCSTKGHRRAPGFRTPVDLVAEVRGVAPRDAVNLLAARFGFQGFDRARRAETSVPPPRVPGGAAPHEPAPDRGSVAEPRRARIVLSTEEHQIADDAIAALIAGCADIYQRGGTLVRVIRDEEKPRIMTLAHPTLRELLAKHVEWVEVREKKGEVIETNAHPPRWCVEAVHARGEWAGARPLRAVVEFPVLRPDGTILSEPGYDAGTQILFSPNAEFEPVAEEPSAEDVSSARALLLDALHDFPFKADCNRSSALAALLTPFARYAFDGAVPSVFIDGNTPGTGKGLLANVLGVVVTGHELDVRVEVTNEDELRKRIMSIARTGDPLVLIDNVTRPIGGGALDAALTARRSWSDRGMATFDEVRTPMVAMWIFTGNNIECKRRDTKRRGLHVRLECDEEEPENRQGFRHHPLLPWVQRSRAALVHAALTILRGYVVAGRPTQALPTWGSFEEWSALVRQAIVWMGEEDPYNARAGLEEGDSETAALGALLEGWDEIANDIGGKKKGCTASEALEALRQDDLARLTPELRRHPSTYPRLREALAELISVPAGALPSAQKLGATLRRFRGRVWNEKKLTCGVYAGLNVWRVVSVATTTRIQTKGGADECSSLDLDGQQ